MKLTNVYLFPKYFLVYKKINSYFLIIAGHQCTAYDVAINTTFFSKVESNLLFQTFLITLAMEGLEDKYSMELDKNGKVKYLNLNTI